MTNNTGAASASVGGGGIGFGGLLTILFIGLKLTGYIDWSWVWVFAPLWIPLAFVLAIGLIVLGGMGLLKLLDRRENKKRAAKRAAARPTGRRLYKP